jgi:photosystem II stability/assembly factor-like uncharacterized protein
VDVRSLAAQDERVYAGTQGSGVFRSDDAGRSWQRAGLDGHIVKALALSPAAPGSVWAATKPPRLFRSDDNGDTWTELGSFAAMRRRWWWQPAERPHTGYVSTLAVSPADADVIVAGIEGWKLLRSTDGARTWTRLGRGVAFDAHELAFHPRAPQRVLLAAGFGASISNDAGATWTKQTAGLDRRYGFCLAPDPADADGAYMAVAPMRTAHTANARATVGKLDGGGWRSVGGGFPEELSQLPYAIAADPAGDVYAGLGDGTLWHSGDGGLTWSVLSRQLDAVRRLAVVP